jgi:hypothetical protein
MPSRHGPSRKNFGPRTGVPAMRQLGRARLTKAVQPQSGRDPDRRQSRKMKTPRARERLLTAVGTSRRSRDYRRDRYRRGNRTTLGYREGRCHTTRSERSRGVADLPIGARRRSRHHRGTAKEVPIFIDRGAPTESANFWIIILFYLEF